MRYTVFGAGAIGGTVGAHMARGGESVLFVDKDVDHVRAMQDRGLTIRGFEETFTVPVEATTPDQLPNSLETVLLAVKAPATEEAVQSFADRLSPEGQVVSLQNGLNELAIASLVGKERTIGAFVNFSADYLEPALIHFGGRGTFAIGELDGSQTPRLNDIQNGLSKWGHVQTTNNIWGYLWGKQAYGAMLFASALTNNSMGDAIDQHRAVMVALANEVLNVASALKIQPLGFDGFDPAALSSSNQALIKTSLDELVAIRHTDEKTHSGVWRDLAVRKRRTEVDAHFLPIVAHAEQLRMEVPLLQRMIVMIHEIEDGQRQFSAANLDELVGIKFQDGTDLNSEAVKFNLERHINDPKATTIQDVKPITSIETPDPLTVKITLEAPFAPFTSRLTIGAGFIQSPTAIQKLGDNLQRDLTGAGSGPYKFVSWQPDNQIVLERNPDFWSKDADGTQLPYLDRIIIKPFPDENVRLTNLKTGDADALMGNPPYKDFASLQQATDLTAKEIPGLGFQFISLNTSKPPFDNPAVRRALSYAIDRDQLQQAALFGRGTTLEAPVPKSVPWAYLAEYQPYAQRDVAKAKQELTSAGMSDVSFSLQISNASPILQQVAELIQGQIKDAGFTMDIQLIEFATIVQNGNTGDYQSLSVGWSGAEDQPMIVLYSEPQISAARKNIQNYPQNYNGWWGGRDLAKIWITK